MASHPNQVSTEDGRSVIAVVFVLPLLNGLMHLPPAVGATWCALGRHDVFDIPVLLMLFALHVLIDGMWIILRSGAAALCHDFCSCDSASLLPRIPWQNQGKHPSQVM